VSNDEALQRTEELARKLHAVTLALVSADEALSARLDKAEAVLKTMGADYLGPYDTFKEARRQYGYPRPFLRVSMSPTPKRPGLLSRVTRRK
jgi:hypothetical protein